MTCPFQYQVFLNRARSYRDLPMRLGETSTLFRNEDSGEMHGLIRVRQFTISEGHLILRPEQLEDEFRGCLDLAKYCLETVGLLEDCSFRFSQWDPANLQNKYEGTPEQWNEAQTLMGKILDDLGVKYTIGIDEAAFYGPKLDIQYKNVFGKEDTLVTIQIDLLLAKQFGMEYVDADGQKKTPYIIHRTSLGCYERTLAYLIEKYAGALPTWMAPEQVRLMADLKEFEHKMDKTLEVLASDFAAVRAGRANAQVLDRIEVPYYGVDTPINQVGTVSSPDPRTLIIQPWDTSLLKAVEKAIQASELGINPQNDGRVIRLVFPQLTEERRKELTKQVRKYGEDAKVALRNVRRDAVEHELSDGPSRARHPLFRRERRLDAQDRGLLRRLPPAVRDGPADRRRTL